MKIIGYRGYISVAFVTAAVALAGCSKSSSGGDSSPPAPKPVSKPAPAVDPNPMPVGMENKGPSTIPVIKDGSIPTADRLTMNQAIARATQENKKIVLEVGAAWCGPCTEFAYDMDTHPDNFKDLNDSGYVLVKAEFERMVVGGGLDFLTLNDYMPVLIGYFPSFYVYDNGAWTGIGSFGSYADLKKTLLSNLQPLTIDEIKAVVQNQKGDDPNADRLYPSVFGNFIGVYNYNEAREIVNLTASSNNKAGYKSLGEFVKSGIWEYVGTYSVTIKQLAADFPDVAATLTDASNDSFSIQAFYYQLDTKLRARGLKQTATYCEGDWAAYRTQIQPGKLSAAEFTAKLAKLDDLVSVTCSHLEWRVTGVTDALRTRVSSINKGYNKDWALLGALGDIQSAKDIFHARYQSFSDEYAKYLVSDQTDLDKAKASGDQAQIDQAQHALDTDNFRIKYHQEVDTEVESNLQNNVPEKSLFILN